MQLNCKGGCYPEFCRIFQKGDCVIEKLKEKIEYAEKLVHCWVDSWGEDGVYIAGSGGKDSTVLTNIVRKLYPNVPIVFSNTGLEYPNIVKFIRTFDNIVELKPKMPFHKVVEKYGWPVISKNIAMAISRCRNTKSERVRDYRLFGKEVDGKKYTAGTIPKKYHYLVDAPFKISDVCCNHLKKEPFKRYEKETGRKPFVGIMASDSNVRAIQIRQKGCNLYDAKHPQSRPLAHWCDEDIWNYIHYYNVPYCDIYDKGEKRTGCVFCMFGIMFDKDRFLRLKQNSPRQYDYVINKLGAAEVLDYIGIKY